MAVTRKERFIPAWSFFDGVRESKESSAGVAFSIYTVPGTW